MGITGLLPLVKPALVRRPIAAYRNKKVGIDGHSWLYQTSHAIAQDVFYGIPTTRHHPFILNRIDSLKKAGVTPIVVFDGDLLPSKYTTNESRKQAKLKIKEEILEHIKQGNMAQAKNLMPRCVSIKPMIVQSTIELLKKESIEYIVSPYESDAQLTYLQRIGYIDAIMTEDSDFIPYGCTNLLYKFDGKHMWEYKKERLVNVKDNFFADNILQICILSGCDYLPSIHGVGLLTAYKLLKKHGSVEAIIAELSVKKEIPTEYIKEFVRAEETFKNQVVYDPIKKRRIFLSGETSSKFSNYEFLGSFLEETVEYKTAMGELLGKYDDIKLESIKISDDVKV
ncbi:Exonuclease 1 [Astathelohania contejeani]|uniref:Exonuclease 1 n=1 Tax=Astathelohania contejeani TaxID=164912 RepID=A0ABQ7I206_9MICR|nr:Exonuclease 1 [Thelohania contejeani]